MAETPGWLESARDGDRFRLAAGGAWTLAAAALLDGAFKKALVRLLEDGAARHAEIDATAITELDTAGAWLLYRARRDLVAAGIETTLRGLADKSAPLLELVEKADQVHSEVARPRPGVLALFVARIGAAVFDLARESTNLLSFFGLTIVTTGRALAAPRRFRVVSLVNQIEQTGLNALAIVGLLLFLIGVVLAFQGAEQLRRFAAEIFTADGLAVIIPREIGVLIAAILIAGRSGSAFTAEIGMMKVNEEVDALRTIGVDPIEALVLPRINALVITLPLLAFFADIAALAGGTIMAVATLDVSYTQFVRQLADALSLKNLLVGLVKAPVFAFLIGMVGCYEGLQVGGSAESIGRLTTTSVVESIVLVILADAGFSILFSALGI